jgi:hypothetical protein
MRIEIGVVVKVYTTFDLGVTGCLIAFVVLSLRTVGWGMWKDGGEMVDVLGLGLEEMIYRLKILTADAVGTDMMVRSEKD